MKPIAKLTKISILLYGACFAVIQAFPATQQAVPTPADITYSDNLTPSPNSPSLTKRILQIEGEIYDLSAMLEGFAICQTSAESPEAGEAINAIQALRALLYEPAQQNRIDPPFCTDLTKSGFAVTAICGPRGTYMRSMDAGKMANQIYRFCRAEFGGEWRLEGRYIFNNRTVPESMIKVYRIRDTE